MEQWEKSTNTEIYKQLQELSDLFTSTIDLFLQEEKKKIDRVLALREELIGHTDNK